MMIKNTFILGISGGADSMCLLHQMSTTGLTIVVTHVNHSLRDSADSDENFVKEYCITNKIPFFSRKVDVAKYAEENKCSVETAGRIARYEFFAEIADKYENPIIVTAHNMNDSAESFLMHLMRGSSLSGLCGIKESSKVKILNKEYQLYRPLINTTREEIEEYNKLNNIPFITDETNSDTSYTRNNIRHNILPFFPLDKLSKAISRLQVDEDFMQLNTPEIENEFSVSWFNKQHLAIKRRIIHETTRKFTSFTVTEERINEAISAIEKNYGGKIIQFPDGVRIEIKNSKVRIYKK